MKKIILLFVILIQSYSGFSQWYQTKGPADTAGNINSQVASLLYWNNELFAGTYNGLFVSQDKGNTWVESDSGINSIYIYSIAAGNNYIYAGTSKGIYRSTDGVTWVEKDSGVGSLFISHLFVKNDTVFVDVANGIYRSADNGDSWIVADSGIPKSYLLNGGAFYSIGNDLLVGVEYGIYISSNNGRTWTLTGGLSLGVNDVINSFAIYDTTIYAGSFGGAYISSVNNINWQYLYSPFNGFHVYALAVNGDTIYAGTEDGFYVSVDTGIAWTLVPPMADIAVNSLTYGAGAFFGGTYGQGVWTTYQSISTAIKETSESNNNIFIFPNPADDKIFININCASGSCNQTNTNLLIYNLLGQLVMQQLINQQTTDLDISNLASGVYLMKLCDEVGTMAVKRFVKQ